MSVKTSPFDAAQYLDSPEMVVAYIDAALETGDAALIALALGDVAKAKGMTEIAREAGVTRDSLYKSLKEGGNPTLATFLGVLKGLGLNLTVQKPAA